MIPMTLCLLFRLLLDHLHPPKQKKESFVKALTGAATTIAKALNPSTISPVQSIAASTGTCNISPLKTTTIWRSCLEDLKRLKDLHDNGVLTDEEFAEEKQQMLASLKNLIHKNN